MARIKFQRNVEGWIKIEGGREKHQLFLWVVFAWFAVSTPKLGPLATTSFGSPKFWVSCRWITRRGHVWISSSCIAQWEMQLESDIGMLITTLNPPKVVWKWWVFADFDLKKGLELAIWRGFQCFWQLISCQNWGFLVFNGFASHDRPGKDISNGPGLLL